MKLYSAKSLGNEVPMYIKDIPNLLPGYHNIVELINTTLRKRRLVACSDTTSANLFTTVFNIVSSFRNYEAQFTTTETP